VSSPYVLTDRRRAGYRGKWRYRVVETAVRGPTPRWSLLFTARNEAATFANQCDAFGVQRAAEILQATGARHGHGFKHEDVHALAAEPVSGRPLGAVAADGSAGPGMHTLPSKGLK
jgi:hypothetical protein